MISFGFRDAPLEDVIALMVFVFAAASAASAARWHRNIPMIFYPQRVKKERELAQLRREAESLNAPATFHLHAKVQRQQQALEKDLLAINRAYRARGLVYNSAPSVMYYVIRFAFVVPMWALWGDLELVMVPDFLLQGLFRHYDSAMAGGGLLGCAVGAVLMPFRFFSFILSSAVASSAAPVTAATAHAAPVHVSHGAAPSGLRSFGVLGWFLLCHIAQRYIARCLFRTRAL